MSLMELITFMWQTEEKPGQGAPFLRLLGFPHLSPLGPFVFVGMSLLITQPNIPPHLKVKPDIIAPLYTLYLKYSGVKVL